MPIEIKELNIKINVDNGNTQQQSSTGESDKEEIIETCVEQVLEILSKKEER